MLPTAHVMHRLGQRTRLRVPERRRDSAWFTQTASRLERVPGVLRVEARSLSGSLLIHHRPDPALERRLAATGRFRIRQEPAAMLPAPEPAAASCFGLSAQTLPGDLGSKTDLRTLVILGLIILAIIQAVRGQVMVPALSLLFFAYNFSLATRDNS